MRKIAEVTTRFPEKELAIHRAWMADLRFREICEDYEVAIGALHFWQSAGGAEAGKADEYGRLVEDLEGEISAFLDRTNRTPCVP